MDWLRQFFFRCRVWFRPRQLEADMAEEMRAHLEVETAAQMCRRTTEKEAAFAAQRSFAGLEQTKERCRDERGISWHSAVTYPLDNLHAL